MADGRYVERSLRDAGERGRAGREIICFRPFGPIIAKQPAPYPAGATPSRFCPLGGCFCWEESGVEEDFAVEVIRNGLCCFNRGADLRPARSEQQDSRQCQGKNSKAQFVSSNALHVNSGYRLLVSKKH